MGFIRPALIDAWKGETCTYFRVTNHAILPPPPARKLFVTTALPYANAPFHIGHMMEYIQADIWVRFQRMRGHEVHFVCADDAHGAPIMIAAEKAGQTPQAFVAGIAAGRKQYLDGFHIGFDNWHSTDGPENHAAGAGHLPARCARKGLIAERTIEQFYDPVKGMFLPDRYIKGECPKCGAKDQYGDNCDVCGAVYSPDRPEEPVLRADRRHARSCRAARTTSSCSRRSAASTSCRSGRPRPGRLQPEVLNKIREWFRTDELGHVSLADWDISRDAPYFGIRIPDTEDKYFYVWLDAPVGYLASLKNCFDARPARDFDAFLADPAVEQVHFIGKDIVYFHTLFWPAMLHFAGRKTPDHVVRARLHHRQRREDEQEPRHRHLAAALPGTRHEPRVAALLHRGQAERPGRGHRLQPGRLRRPRQQRPRRQVRQHRQPRRRLPGQALRRPVSADVGVEGRALLDALRSQSGPLAELYEAREFGKALREIMALADRVNAYVDTHKPWELARQPDHAVVLHDVCSVCIEAFRVLTVYLKPVLPALAWSSSSRPAGPVPCCWMAATPGKARPLRCGPTRRTWSTPASCWVWTS